MHTHYQVLGIMSGTSMDGVDLAVSILEQDERGWSYEILAAECIPYTAEWKQKLSTAKNLGGYDLLALSNEYGNYLGILAKSFLYKSGLKAQLISSHGHTIFHDPANKISYQLGSGPAILAASGIPVVCEFRTLDVCLGGQGAPLVPMGDELLFAEYDFCLNLGGIANVSYKENGLRKAYDICVCNLLLNHYAEQAGYMFDKDGAMAAGGKTHTDLLNELNKWLYYALPAPKSLDKDISLAELIPLVNKFPITIHDKLATLSKHIADRITEDIISKISSPESSPKVLVTGGGAHNTFLMEQLRKSDKIQFIVPDAQTVDFKEALIFGFLGILRVLNKINTLASVTGADSDSSGGAVYRIRG